MAVCINMIRMIGVNAAVNNHNSHSLKYEWVCVCVFCEESMWCYRGISVLMRGCGQGGRGQPLPQAKSRGSHTHTHWDGHTQGASIRGWRIIPPTWYLLSSCTVPFCLPGFSLSFTILLYPSLPFWGLSLFLFFFFVFLRSSIIDILRITVRIN